LLIGLAGLGAWAGDLAADQLFARAARRRFVVEIRDGARILMIGLGGIDLGDDLAAFTCRPCRPPSLSDTTILA